MNKRKAIVKGKMGLVTASYTHTYDVFMFKTKTMLTGVSKKYVHLLPMDVKKGDPAQLKLAL